MLRLIAWIAAPSLSKLTTMTKKKAVVTGASEVGRLFCHVEKINPPIDIIHSIESIW